jgi:hypothetical protein
MQSSRLLAATATTLLSAACFVGVDIQEVSDPGPAFAEARAEAARVAGRAGPAGSLQVLVYDREDGQLIRASLPMWVVEKAVDDDEEIDLDLGQEAAERLRSRLRLSDLKEAPLGPLVEVEEEDGDQVLVWLK